MMHAVRMFFFTIVLSAFVLERLPAQEIQTTATADSLSNSGLYQLWLDAGFNPFGGNTYSGEFDPILNLRLGIGKEFN
ncbi:MAG: hypothetical protein KGJ59_09910, partial [Bacteroidota bacterium]|nr:hypothetical protein [Bacteroidota bacterium]